MWLAISGLMIVLATLVYSNFLVNRIAREERNKVELWANAIQKRAELVYRSSELFKKFEQEDRKNADLYGKASRYFVTCESIYCDFELATAILGNNTNIPVIVVDQNDEIKFYNNIPETVYNDTAAMRQRLEMMKSKNYRIDVSYKLPGNITISQYLYYDDSYIYSELKQTIDNLVESFISETVINSASVPVVFTNETQDSVISYANIVDLGLKPGYTNKELINAIRGQNEPIVVKLEEGMTYYIFYRDSYVIRMLQYFPLVLLTIISVFLLVAYLLFSTARRSEQNQIWVGLSKETAHQLGTPITSLIGWVELLKASGQNHEAAEEIEKDIWRLQTVTERFSKIGSQPELKDENLYQLLENIVSYMRKRTSSKIQYEIIYHIDKDTEIPLNKPLFEWVIENLCRNSIDAITAPGKIIFEVSDAGKFYAIDVTDTGKGMPKNQFKTVFRPGYTTKKRGWGLGLSLTRRIVQEYHGGKIFVKYSEVGKGTTFRILLRS